MKASENPYPKITLAESAAPGTPTSGQGYIYASTGGTPYYVNDSGVETALGGGTTTTVATDAIWDAAGDLAVGSGANTAAKLGIGAAGGALSVINSAVAWNSGTSFPANKATGDRYWRTDLGLEFYWDGTRWVTTQEFSLNAGMQNVSTNISTFAMPARSDLDMYLTVVQVATYVGATNNGSHYWTVRADKLTTSLGTFTTASDTEATYTVHTITVNAALGGAASYPILSIGVTETGTAGNIYVAGCFRYRLIGT